MCFFAHKGLKENAQFIQKANPMNELTIQLRAKDVWQTKNYISMEERSEEGIH